MILVREQQWSTPRFAAKNTSLSFSRKRCHSCSILSSLLTSIVLQYCIVPEIAYAQTISLKKSNVIEDCSNSHLNHFSFFRHLLKEIDQLLFFRLWFMPAVNNYTHGLQKIIPYIILYSIYIIYSILYIQFRI